MSIIVFLILYFSLIYLSKPTGYILDKNWSLSFDNTTKVADLPYYDFPEQSGLAYLRTSFHMPIGDTLVIPKISCYAYKAYINDNLIYQVGDFNNPTANIWNYSHVINLDRRILKDRNELVIEAYLLDDVGMHIPPYIDKRENVTGKISVFNFINNDIHLIMLGISISISIIMIAISMPKISNKSMYFYLGLSSILVALYSFDCLYRISSGDVSTFLTIRKILFSSCYLAGAFQIRGMEKYTGKTWKIRNIILCCIAMAVVILLLSRDFIELRSRINVLNVLMVISPIYSIGLIFHKKISQLYFSTTFVTLTLVYTVLSVIFKAHTPYLLPYGIIVYSLGLNVSLILEFTNIYHEKDEIYLKSITDHLTSAYNRNILEEVHMEANDILILIDVDNLKYYNDTFGHGKGDALLIEIVDIVKNHIRKSDFIIRLGGDEFLIILKSAHEQAAEKIISRIRKEFKLKNSSNKVDISFGILRYQADFEKSYNQVDKIMYKMKTNKKYNEAKME